MGEKSTTTGETSTTTGEIIIRTALPEDLATLLTFEQDLILTERPMDPTIQEGSIHYYDIGAMIDDPDIEVVVAEQSGALIGSGYARIETGRHYLKHRQHAYLGFMYVVPTHRGKGVNQMIIAALRQWALSRQITELRLTVYETNESAIRAYEKAGFTRHLVEMRMGLH